MKKGALNKNTISTLVLITLLASTTPVIVSASEDLYDSPEIIFEDPSIDQWEESADTVYSEDDEFIEDESDGMTFFDDTSEVDMETVTENSEFFDSSDNPVFYDEDMDSNVENVADAIVFEDVESSDSVVGEGEIDAVEVFADNQRLDDSDCYYSLIREGDALSLTATGTGIVPRSLLDVLEGFSDYDEINSISITFGEGLTGSNCTFSSFEHNDKITSVSLPESFTSISDHMFSNCVNLEELNIPKNVTYIGKYAISGCSSIKEISLPDSVTELGPGVLFYCVNLCEVRLPNHLTYIPREALACNPKLTTIDIPASVTEIGPHAFNSSGLRRITLPNGILKIDNSAFVFCEDLYEIALPNTLKCIGELAFGCCRSLTNLELPEGLEEIGSSAFNSCVNLKKVTFPSSLRIIGKNIFQDCPIQEESVIDMSFASVSINNQTYTGIPRKPNPVIKVFDIPLTNGTDYSVSYRNNTNTGTATCIISGKGPYSGTIKKTFRIAPASITKTAVTGIVSKTWTGKSISQNPVVKLGAKTLIKGTDYTLSFKNRVSVGTATMYIKGKGNLTGTLTKAFKIIPKGTSITNLTSASQTIIAKWTKQSALTSGYQIQWSLSKTFASGRYAKTIGNPKTVSYKITGLKSGKTYYVRIRTYKKIDGKSIFSKWSAAKSVIAR